ncbi:MAG: hypothetical protein ABEH35_05880 [Haloarculaceae archaeon]
MLRRDFIRAGTAAGVLGLAGCQSGDQPAFSESFEDGIGEWESDAAIGPEVDISEFEWTVEVSTDEAADGERSLKIVNEGDYDDGTTWAVHPVSVPSDGRYTVTVTVQCWSESESFNTIRDAVMRLGPDRPTAEEDFPQPGVNTTALDVTPYGGLREPLWLADGWREYTFEWTTPELTTDTLFLAVGTSVIWETEATHYVDAITVEFDQQ